MGIARVVVAGSINMDVIARVDRFPEPGETLIGEDVRFSPGGKGANQAVAASRCGASVQMLGCVGDDAFGQELSRFLTAEGVDVSCVSTSATASTGTALIVVDRAGENTIVAASGANAELAPESVDGVALEPGDVVLSQNEIAADTIVALFARARAAGVTSILNAAPALTGRDHVVGMADIVVVNESEADSLSVAGAQVLVVTLGSAGVRATGPQGEFRIGGHAVNAVDTTGAGDCFVGAMAAQLAGGVGLEAALRFANAAASLAVQSHGAGPAMPRADEVDEVLR